MKNKSIALNILKTDDNKKISHYYKSELLKDNEIKHLFVKNLNALLKRIYACSENYCINCLKPFRTKRKLKKYQESC